MTKDKKDEDEDVKKPVENKLAKTKTFAKSVTLNNSKTKLDRVDNNNKQSFISDLSQKEDSLMGSNNNLKKESLKNSSKNRPLYKTETGELFNIIEYNKNNVVNFDDKFD